MKEGGREDRVRKGDVTMEAKGQNDATAGLGP